MFTKEITYTDYAGETRKQDFQFNLTTSEVVKLQYSINGGIDEFLKQMINKNDQVALVEFVTTIIRAAYGEKSVDGSKFVKVSNGHKLVEDFEQTPAYDSLFMELITDSKAAAEFINGIFPPDLVAKLNSQLPDGLPTDINDLKDAITSNR
jgi:hypothetical protein